MFSQPSNILEVLPVDVLDLILQELKGLSFSSLISLRLVCREFSALVEPLAFSAVTLLPYKPLSSNFQAQLKHLASGKGPNSRWTKELRIGPASLIPVLGLQGGHSWASQDAPDTKLRRQSALVIQRKYLVRAIVALKHVTFARYHPQDKEPYEDVLGALSRLPNLEHISLDFASKFGEQPLPLAAFSRLRIVELAHPHLFPSVISSIQGMLMASCTTLESLTLTPYDWGQETGSVEPPRESKIVRVLDMDGLFGGPLPAELTPVSKKETAFARLSSHIRNLTQKSGPQDAQAQYPRLKRLVLNTNRFRLSAAVVPRLLSLTHLEAVTVGAGHIEESFWQALSKEKIRLEFLTLWSLSSPVTQYLSTYSGLKTLFLRDLGEAVSMAEEHGLFTVVLRRHSRTLENLWLDAPGQRGYSTAIEERLEGICRCRELQNLWISYPFPAPSTNREGGDAECSDRRSEELGAFLSRLAVSLPKLCNLLIRPSRQLPRFGCGTWRKKHLSTFMDEFVEAVLKADIAGAVPSFSISVRGLVGGGVMDFDRERGRFKKA